jgi:hypothetical protein
LPALAHQRFLVAIETDATRYHGEHATRPALLNSRATEQILAHVSADLTRHFPQINSCSLSLAGALFDQTQLLRPGFPIYTCLESLQVEAGPGKNVTPGLLCVSAEKGKMPHSQLQPEKGIPLGLLQTLPVSCYGEVALIEDLSAQMEHRFLESGQLSAHSAKALEANFGIAVNHARFMTVTDLNAMLHLQLDHFGFLPLWQLLDAAINEETQELCLHGQAGQSFTWTGEAVRCTFETFDFWATNGTGKKLPADRQLLADSYSEWTREYRQYLTTLEAHGVPVIQFAANDPDQELAGSFLIEHSNQPSRPGAVQITEHSSGELGTVAVSVVYETGMVNYYPLVPSGLNDLHATIREALGTRGVLSFPGGILYNEKSRQLQPDVVQA